MAGDDPQAQAEAMLKMKTARIRKARWVRLHRGAVSRAPTTAGLSGRLQAKGKVAGR
jgi:hypothetical protein